ncbi:MAG: mucoidy inhibitor MuiA family protein [Candidatus Sigynarchaeota archaeon]
MPTEKDLKTHPDRVIIFQEGAQVTRSGKIKLDAGLSVVKIGGIPPSVDPQSIRVKGTGPGQVLNMVVKKAYAEKAPPGKQREIVDKLKALGKELRGIDDMLAGKEAALAQYKASIATATSKFPLFSATGKVPFATYAELDESLTARVDGTIDEIAALQQQKKAVNNQIAVLQKEFQKLRGKQGTVESQEVLLDIESKDMAEFEFVVSYVFKSSSQARWKPFYEVYLKETGNEALLKLNGLVTNATGEDWLDVKLALSTANIRPVAIVEPSPFIIRAHKPMPQVAAKVMAAAPMSRPASMFKKASKEMEKREESIADEDLAMPEAAPEPEAEIDMASVTEEAAEVHEGVGIQVYEVPGKVNIPNGKDSGPYFLKEFTLESTLEIYWSSAQGEMSIARNRVKNTVQVLLPGQMRTYIDNEFTGESQLDLVRPFEEFDAGIRESKVVKVRKTLVDRGRKKSGMVKDKVSRHYGYRITLELLADLDTKIVVQDVIPISDSTRITIENVKFSKEPDKNVSGVLTWKIPTKGMKKLDIDYEFDVLYEKNVEVIPPLP